MTFPSIANQRVWIASGKALAMTCKKCCNWTRTPQRLVAKAFPSLRAEGEAIQKNETMLTFPSIAIRKETNQNHQTK